jgi:hypothetical protein
MGGSTLENGKDIGEIEKAEVITFVCSFLTERLNPERLNKANSYGGSPPTVGVQSIWGRRLRDPQARHGRGGVGKFRFASDQR